MDQELDGVVTNVRERPSSTDLVRQLSQGYRSLRALARRLYTGRATSTSFASSPVSGFIGDGFMLQPQGTPSMVLTIKAGQGFFDATGDVPVAIGGITGLDDRESYKPLLLSADQSINVPAADPTDPRIDILEVTYDRRMESFLSRDIFSAGPPFQFNANNVFKILAWLQDTRVSVDGVGGGLMKINYKTGTPNPAPVAPSVTAGYTKIAEVRVGNGVTTLGYEAVRDMRRILSPHGEHRFSVRFTNPFAVAAPTILGVNAPPGMRFCISRTAGAGFYTLRILPGAAVSRFSVTGSVHSFTLSEMFTAQFGTPVAGTVSGPDQTEMANAAVSSPVVNAPVGADVLSVYGLVTRQAGSTTGVITADVDMGVDVSFGY